MIAVIRLDDRNRLSYRLGHGTLGCQACVEIPAQRPLQTSSNVAQLIVSF